MIPLNSPVKPDIKKLNRYLEAINESGWYTNFGRFHDELAERLADYLGVEYLLPVANGTFALQLAARALSAESVLTTPFSFVATTSAFLWQNVPCEFADIDRRSYNLSPDAVEKAFADGCECDAIVPTHVYGNPCDVESFEDLGTRLGKKVIYDAAHAFGVRVADRSVLDFGTASILSFHATKVFHTVEGGAVVFRNEDDYARAKGMINFGIVPGQGIRDVGMNGKLNEYQSAVGLVLLDSIADVLDHRAEVFTYYRESLDGIVELPEWHERATLNGAYMPAWFGGSEKAEQVRDCLQEAGIASRRYFYPSLDNEFADCRAWSADVSNEVADGILCLPMHVDMGRAEVDQVVAEVKRCLSR